jgi:hypothetical protein
MKIRSLVLVAVIFLVAATGNTFAQLTTRSLHPSVTIAPAGREIGSNDSIRIVYTPSRDTTNTPATPLTSLTQVFAYTTARSVGASGWEGQYEVTPWGQVGTAAAQTLTRQGAIAWVLSIPSIRNFYKVAAGTNLAAILFVFRNADGSIQGKDVAVQLSGTATSVRNADVFTSASAYPNPSSEYANISFGLKATGSVTLKIFDALGNEVKTLVNGETLASNTTHIMQWDATNNTGAKVSSGAYFYRLVVNGVSETGSVVINR